MKNETNIDYSYPNHLDNEEAMEHINFIKNSVLAIYQDALVYKLMNEGIISWDDVENLFYDCEECEGCKNDTGCEEQLACEIYHWIATTETGHILDELKRQGHPILDTDYGTWIGRTDTGSSQDIYFIPSLANSIYNK